MKLKSYFSSSVQEALAQARRELGEDALLVNARPAGSDARHLGSYEVVFGVQAAERAVRVADPVSRFGGDLVDLRRQLDRLTQLLEPAQNPSTGFTTNPSLGRVVALVGPPGAGKTTTLVKLAARYGLACRRRPHILTADVIRIAACDQVRTLAAILGIGCEVVETPLALAQALEERRNSDLVLIDTPGLGVRDMDDAAQLAQVISSNPEIDVHLVLAASTQPACMARMIGQYSIFKPSKLLFTRLDETTNFDAPAEQAVRSGLPLSFLGTGQQIPDDFEEATPDKLQEWKSAGNSWPARMGATA